MIDAAKTMRLFHESPGLTLRELTLPFLDARKRVAHYPDLEHSIRLAAVPTTAGTGSEVSPAAVLTSEGRKLTLVDYSLVPDVAIVEPRLTLTMPPAMTADTGVDALTHALEAYVSIFASPFTDAFCLQAVHLILEALPRAVRDGDDLAGADGHGQRGDDRRARLLQRLRRRQPRARPRRRGTLRRGPRPRQRPVPAPACCATTPRCRASSCRPPATAPTSRPPSSRRWPGSWGSAGTRRRSRASACSSASTPSWTRSACRARPRTPGSTPERLRASIPDLVRDAFRDPSLRTNPRMPLLDELGELLGAVCDGEASPR